MNNLRPFGDYVLVERIPVKPENESKIVLPDSIKQPLSNFATVLKIGSRVSNVQPGDVIFFGRYSKSVPIDDSDTFVLVSEAEILAIVENE